MKYRDSIEVTVKTFSQTFVSFVFYYFFKSICFYHLHRLFRRFFHFLRKAWRLLVVNLAPNVMLAQELVCRQRFHPHLLGYPWILCVLQTKKASVNVQNRWINGIRFNNRMDKYFEKVNLVHDLPSKLEFNSFGCSSTDFGETYSKLVQAGRGFKHCIDGDWAGKISPALRNKERKKRNLWKTQELTRKMPDFQV